jgi:hypothetical protein
MPNQAQQKSTTKSIHHQPTLREILMTEPVNNLHTRRIVEFLAPVRLFVEIDEYGGAHLLGQAGLEGHFQVGVLARMQAWTPAQDQKSLLSWKQAKEERCILHVIQRPQQICSTEMEIALVQHCPLGPLTPDINYVTITPLWDKQRPFQPQDTRLYQRGCSYTCYLTHQCPCKLYLSMLQHYQAPYYASVQQRR